MREQGASVRNSLLKERKLTKEIEQQLIAAMQAFQKLYKPVAV